ncbi:hypothetical protein J4E83_005147 [Alternaria metachromatica]|uniref:uncharacterized protein n=1 Tax=Alternaria metachromatica TaxID=283354 RepID=UPI0020C5013C|nr:uncharacterized protein J4E83_005147 [Alternaria metachromatica]KAI4620786.1 hypothetical protein J4E83_005147 [Alternaria metachromatica]
MTPKTRSSNQDADYKVYYSKKVPQQVRFPHKRKTVRRRSTPVHDGKRQMVFLPDKMRRQGTPVVADSDEDIDTDLEEDLEDGGVSIKAEVEEEEEEEQPVRQTKRKGKKRNSDGVQQEDDGEKETSEPTSKRRRTAATPKNPRRSRRVEAESDDDNEATATKTNRERTLRRQSTMTQLVDGRKPLPDDEEPSFKPVKQSSRLSWGGRGKSEAKSDRRQRTLTQMIPGMRPQEIMSDEDLDEILSDVEAEERASQTYGDAVAQRLAQQGFYRVEGNGVSEDNGANEAGNDMEQSLEDEHIKKEPTTKSQDTPELVVQSVEDEMDEDCEDSYKPTQFIEAPVTRTTRATRRGNRPRVADTEEAFYAPQGQAKTRKTRFSLLATPEKRRVREIPSSQSPADSPLSTQVSPQKLHRSPLKQRSDNSILAPETPSKRKQVTFKMPSKTPIPPPTLRKFESTIQDSEDEDDGVIEEDLPTIGRGGGGTAQASSGRLEAATGKAVGTDTQAVLDRIDQACADANGEEVIADLASSQESRDLPELRGDQEPSPELGDPQKQSSGRSSSTVAESVAVKQEPVYDDDDYEDDEDDDATILPTVPFDPSNEERPIKSETNTSSGRGLPLPEEQLRSTPPVIEDLNQETCPSTPMVINDDSSEEEEDEPAPDPTPPRSSKVHIPQSTSTDIHQSADLDSESIQVPRSPSPDHETQQSHSSKAEQQLHNEWFSYSQYINARAPQSSSMHAAPDAFSYNYTPRLPQPIAPQSTHQPSGYHPSQATTVDEITQRTPRRKRAQHFSSTHTTPHRIASSQPNISPGKPPPLFIPSSFPSPEKVAAEGEGWSSPMFGLTQAVGGYRSSQWASLEDFSIPAPPPGWDGGGDGDDE